MWILALLLKEGKERHYPLRSLPQVIGNGREAQIRINHESVSAAHARLFERNNVLYLADLGSDAGTFVNSRKIDEAALRDGDRIEVGAGRFRLQQVGSKSRTRPASSNPDLSASSEIRTRSEILQFNRRDAQKGRTFLRDDFSQIGGGFRLLIVLGFAALAVGIFFFFMWLAGLVFPG